MASDKVSVITRVYEATKEIFGWGEMFEPTITVQEVVDGTIKKAAARVERPLNFKFVESCQSEEAMARQGTLLDADDLSDMNCSHLRANFGCYLKVHVEYGDKGDASTSKPALPSALKEVMEAQQQQLRARPTPPIGERYDFRIFRALVADLERNNLDFPLLDANSPGSSGHRMLKALSLALQYVLPFDDIDPSPLRLDGRIHLVVPTRFTTKARAAAARPGSSHATVAAAASLLAHTATACR